MDSAGILYLVATPIGNLADFSQRAIDTLQSVDFIAAEDTRHSRPLLFHYGIDKPLIALHEHNEDAIAARLVDRLVTGESGALISDAGTPLINDPGFPLVRGALERHIRVIPIPGPCALIAALSASGLSAARFAFEGFPPRSASARRKLLESLASDPRTLIFYESSHRVRDFIGDIAAVLEAERPVVIARELTKLHETIVKATAASAPAVMDADPNMVRGEFVILIAGAPEAPAGDEGLTPDQLRVLKLLLEECTVKTAAALTARITGARREQAYREALLIAKTAARTPPSARTEP